MSAFFRCCRAWVFAWGTLAALCGGCARPCFDPMPHQAPCGCGAACDAGCQTHGEGCASFRAAWHGRSGGLLPFCAPPAELVPTDPPPPARFHPVPTQPVFGGAQPLF